MFRILAVEDAEEQALIIKRALGDETHLVVVASTLAEAEKALAQSEFDLILLDVSLPDGDGFQFFASLRQSGKIADVPVMFFTGKVEVAEKVLGFSLGAEDYLTKPVHPLELKARVDARLKSRERQKRREDILRRGDLQINVSLQQASCLNGARETRLDLTPLEFKLLLYFARHEGQVFSRQQLMDAIHGADIHVSERTVDTHVSNIRRKLAPTGYTLKAIYGVGYSFAKSED